MESANSDIFKAIPGNIQQRLAVEAIQMTSEW